MKLLKPISLLLSFTTTLASYLTPTLHNQHLKLSDTDQKILLIPFKSVINNELGLNIDQSDSTVNIVQSSIRIISDTYFAVTFIITPDNHMSEEYRKFTANIDLDSLTVDDLVSHGHSLENFEFGETSQQNQNQNLKFFNQIKIENNHQYLMDKTIEDQFKEYLQKFGLSEAALALDNNQPEFLKRYLVFAKNVVKTAWMNVLERGSAKYGVTGFSDLTVEEFAKFYKMPENLISNHLRTKIRNFKMPSLSSNKNDNYEPPSDYDWRQHNAVTPVKNQGMCGSCWSFSTTGNIEGVHAVATGKLISLSEQELVDCDKTDQGCNGGLMDNAFEQIEELGGLETEEDYKYEGQAGKCRLDKSKIAVNITGYHDVPVGDEIAMRNQLLETGPLAVALNAMWMQFYRGGVSHPWKRLCSPKMLDHGVLIVGYGVEPANPDHVPFPKKEQPFWTIKNSWGPSWGEDGYYRLYRGDGTCGIDQYVTTSEA